MFALRLSVANHTGICSAQARAAQALAAELVFLHSQMLSNVTHQTAAAAVAAAAA
jgi:hypothetical protein